MTESLGKIVDINGNYVTIKIGFNVSNYGNLMNVHLVFDDGRKKIIGEIVKGRKDVIIEGNFNWD